MATLPLLPRLPQTNGGVLVASSDATLREQLVTNLNSQQWPVLVAHGGADALGKLENSECDILLLDRELSDLDCEELVHLVEAQYGYPEQLADVNTREDLLQPMREAWPVARQIHWPQFSTEMVNYLADVRKLVSVLFRFN